ncbi:uncharacterized protein LOC129215139 [Grus americana]|uniref:uncharacterized protein LOC129215139 n=1 Tax=Grus americana TaxID=9117 RepID=UPI0024080496|nr:uncharacterized protein LOC129215139 [Grus americana]
MTVPALGLPNPEKPFKLFVRERQHVALGVLIQKTGSWKRPVGYFSKQLDQVSKGWPSCLQAVAAMALLIQEARKLTLGQKIIVQVPHAVTTILEQKGGHWLSPSRMMKYQAILLEQDDTELKVVTVLNPATLLPLPGDTEFMHDCVTTIEQVYSSSIDLKDEPLEFTEVTLYVDGSSFVRNGQRKSGHAVVTEDEVVEAEKLLTGTSAQKTELITLIRALEISTGKRVNIWTDSKYAFGVVHAHGAIWKERGLLTAPVKYGQLIGRLLEAVHLPKQVAVMHCKAHQFRNTATIKGNWKADVVAKQLAEKKYWGYSWKNKRN